MDWEIWFDVSGVAHAIVPLLVWDGCIAHEDAVEVELSIYRDSPEPSNGYPGDFHVDSVHVEAFGTTYCFDFGELACLVSETSFMDELRRKYDLFADEARMEARI